MNRCGNCGTLFSDHVFHSCVPRSGVSAEQYQQLLQEKKEVEAQALEAMLVAAEKRGPSSGFWGRACTRMTVTCNRLQRQLHEALTELQQERSGATLTDVPGVPTGGFHPFE